MQAVGSLADLALERLRVANRDAELAAVVDASGDAIVSTGLDGTIRSWNPAATAIYGRPADRGRRPAVLDRRPGRPGRPGRRAAPPGRPGRAGQHGDQAPGRRRPAVQRVAHRRPPPRRRRHGARHVGGGPRHHRAQAGRAGPAGGQGGGGPGQPRQERVPVADEPRAAHAAERHPRLRPAAGARGPDRAEQRESRRAHPQGRPAPARPDQRGARHRRASRPARCRSRSEPVAVAEVVARGRRPDPPAGRPAARSSWSSAARRAATCTCSPTASASSRSCSTCSPTRSSTTAPGGTVALACEPPADGDRVRGRASPTPGPGIPPERLGQLFMPVRAAGRRADRVEGTGLGPGAVAAAGRGHGRHARRVERTRRRRAAPSGSSCPWPRARSQRRRAPQAAGSAAERRAGAASRRDGPLHRGQPRQPAAWSSGSSQPPAGRRADRRHAGTARARAGPRAPART